MADLGNIGTINNQIVFTNTLITNIMNHAPFSVINMNDDLSRLMPVRVVSTGTGSITGTLTINAVPKRRAIALYESANNTLVDTTFSDEITGEFIFTNLDTTISYTVLSRDHPGNTYNIVSKINVIAV